MACTPFNPAVGIFYNTYGWGLTNAGSWTFGPRSGSPDRFELKRSGVLADEIWIPTPSAVRWFFFPSGNFLAVRNAISSGGFDDYSIWIFDLRNPSAVTHYQVVGPWSINTGGQLHIHMSSDGLAFMLFASDSLPNSTKQHQVFRTDTGDMLCSWGPITSVVAGRYAEITASRTVRIYTSPAPGGSRTWSECPLPSGRCDVTPDTQTFPEAVFGGPSTLATTTRQFTIRNTGNDCLSILAIANAGVFSVTATSRTFPAELRAGETMTVTVTFTPTGVGSFGPTNLPITRLPANGDDRMECRGNARPPVARLTISPLTLAFGRLAVGSTRPMNVRLRNDGEVPINLAVPVSPASIPFSWNPLTATLGLGDSRDIAVTFAPTAEGAASATLIVNNLTQSMSTNVAISGSGCVANAEMILPPAPYPSFGQIQRGFRLVRTIQIQNTGDGELNFTARIDGPDFAMYGLVQDPPNESVIDVVRTRTYSVQAVSPCGGAMGGSGLATLAIVFFANDAPRITAAELVIESHNATNGLPATIRYSLQGEITAPAAVDAMLVLDRSGSMSTNIGARSKSEAAIAGGRLFAQLIRPNMDDRLGIVKYDDVIEVVQPITSVTAANHNTIINRINSTELAPRGLTCIAGGAMVALEQIALPRSTVPPVLTKAVVVLTDGMDNTAYQNPSDSIWYSILGNQAYNPLTSTQIATTAMPTPTGVKIYGVGLGKAEDIDSLALNRLSSATGAYHGVVQDLVGQQYFSIEKYFAQIYMDIVGIAPITDPVFTILPGTTQTHEFDVLRGDVSAMVLLFDYVDRRLPFTLISPKGEVFDGISLPVDFQMRMGSSITSRFVEIQMPAGQPDRYAGRWKVVVEHRNEVYSGSVGPQQDNRPGFIPFKTKKYKDPVDYGILLGAGSNFRMQPYMTPSPVRVGDPILLSAVVSEAGLPSLGCRVTVKAIAPSGATWNIDLWDDGAHSDMSRNDGEYANTFLHTSEAGAFEFIFRATGLSRDGEPVVRESVRTKYVQGRIEIPPNIPADNNKDDCCKKMLKLLEKLAGGKPSRPPIKRTKVSVKKKKR